MRKIILALVTLFSMQTMYAQNQGLNCGTDDNYQHLLLNNPELQAAKQKFDADFATYLKSYPAEKTVLKKAGAPKYIIPVVVHILHNNGSENISYNQVKSEIDFLNQSFRNLVSDSVNRRKGTFNGVDFDFKNLAADAEIEFRLARKDPNGNCTDGIVRVQTPFTSKGNDDLKKLSVWDTKKYFNMWVVRQINRGNTIGIAGYAQFPFGFGGGSTTDGIIVIHNEFGNIGTSLPGQTPKVTTTTHEVGHWFGLYHPFQNSGDSCALEGDGVLDTPPTYFSPSSSEPLRNRCNQPNFNSCTSDNPDLPDLQEAYMDYFIGNCASNMFTKQQVARMHFVLENYRTQLWQPENLAATGVDGSVTTGCAPIAGFSTTTKTVCAGGVIAFNEFSFNTGAQAITSWEWSFPGGSPASASTKIPGNITYSTPGTYNVSLKVSNANGEQTTTLNNYITVLPSSTSKTPGWRTTADWWYMNNWEEEGWYMEYDNNYQKFAKVGVSYDNIAGMKLAQDPFNQKYSIGSNYSIISPAFNMTGTTSPYIAFNYAFAQATLSANIGGGNTKESLTIFTSTDCGKTWLARASRGSTNISTIGNTTLTNATNFVPSEKAKWAELLYSGGSFPKTDNVRFKITFNYAGGNNFYIDNIRIGDGSAATGLNKDLAQQLNFTAMPNPLTENTQIAYTINANQNVNITLVDILGKEITTVFNGNQTAGDYNFDINKYNLNLNQGIYFINMQVDNQKLSYKLIVQ